MSAMAVSSPVRLRATLIGFAAVLLWSTLALATSFAAALPPFQLMSMTFALAFALAVASWAVRGRAALAALGQTWPIWALGIGGLFGYHLFYFTALRHAPVVEASLIAYLWPLLIVLMSALLPGERLTLRHVAGAIAGLGRGLRALGAWAYAGPLISTLLLVLFGRAEPSWRICWPQF